MQSIMYIIVYNDLIVRIMCAFIVVCDIQIHGNQALHLLHNQLSCAMS